MIKEKKNIFKSRKGDLITVSFTEQEPIKTTNAQYTIQEINKIVSELETNLLFWNDLKNTVEIKENGS